MGKQYIHMSSEERALLQIGVSNGASIRSIARRLSRSASTLSPCNQRAVTRVPRGHHVAIAHAY